METGNEPMSIDITKLRMERRPLWMTPLGISSFAEMLGDGGDIYTDRLTPDFPEVQKGRSGWEPKRKRWKKITRESYPRWKGFPAQK